ncbi:MAG: carboxypeptidase regulatory-like domain-containing protein [Thermodesulfobacteriota bacterium]
MIRMKQIPRVLTAALLALVVGWSQATLAATTKTLTAGTVSGNHNATVNVPISVSDPTGVGGAAFTLLYNPSLLTFVGLQQAGKAISDGSTCVPQGSAPPDYSGCSATTVGSTMFYQFNDVKDQANTSIGKVMVAAASAQALTQGTLFNAQFTIKGGSGSTPIQLVRSIINNPAAGYNGPTLLPVLVGMPAAQPVNGYYPTEVFDTLLVNGAVNIAAPGYTISGTVTYGGGAAANGSTVVLKTQIGTTSTYAPIAQTTVAAGAYSFTNRPDGSYLVEVTPADPAYFKQSATVTVAGANTTQNFVLPAAQRYSGTVTINGAVLAGLRVKVMDGTTLIGIFPVDPATGYFETRPLDPTRTYTFYGVYGDQEWLITQGTTNNKTDLTLYTISGSVTGIDCSTSTVSLMAVSATRKLQLTGICAGGAYTLNNALPGSDYVVSAATLNQPVQYYNGVTDVTLATRVDTSAGNATGIDFSYASTQKATIAGRVTRDGAALAARMVYAFEVNTYALSSVLTDQAGDYSLALAPGSYKIFAFRQGGKTFYYSDSGTVQKESLATVLTVANGDGLTGKNLDLTICGNAVNGKVTNVKANTPVAGVLISVSGTAGQGNAFTGADGTYSIGGLCDGTYTVTMEALQGNYGKQQASVTLAGANGTVNFDLNTGSTLSGTVTRVDGTTAIAGAMLYLVDTTTGQLIGGRVYFSDAAGAYSIADIPSGIYTLVASHKDYDTTIHPNLDLSTDATQDVVLTKGGYLTGTVTDASGGAPLGGVMVIATASGQNPRFAVTNSQGVYAIYGLSTTANYLAIASTPGYERSVSVVGTVSATGTVQDIALTAVAQTFTLTGTVTEGCGNTGVAGAKVIASYTPGNGAPDFFKVATTDANGLYTLGGLPQASGYTLVVVPGGNLRVQKATGIDGTGQTTVTQDFVIPCGSTISGTITGVTAGPVFVVLFDATSGTPVDLQTLSTANGTGGFDYTFSNIAAGTYKVAASAVGSTATWYNGVTDITSATAVNSGDAGVDIALP